MLAVIVVPVHLQYNMNDSADTPRALWLFKQRHVGAAASSF